MSECILATACLLLGCCLLRGGLGTYDRAAKTVVWLLTLTTGANYIWWRASNTVDYTFALSIHFFFPLLFFIFEASRLTHDAFMMATLTRRVSRSPVADVYEKRLRELGLKVPRVDVFIPTYEEPENVLRRTILGVKALDYPHVRIFVLDDTSREWLRNLCAAENVEYFARKGGPHAKAGNLNNALSLTSRDPSPFILCLDADFVPYRHFLYRTLGFFLHDERIGLVQTPQYFFNSDPPQINLLASRHWVDEQRFFFDVLLESMDVGDRAFCVGTSCVWRRDAIEEIGGVQVECAVEDIHLSYRLSAAGWKTRYLNERLSNGLAAETIGEFVRQRVRWAIGCTQALWMRYGPFGWNRLTFGQRAQYFSTILYWINLTFMLLAMVAPPLYWLVGVRTIETTPDELLRNYLPYFACSTYYMLWVGRGCVLPVISEAVQLVCCVPVVVGTYRALLGLGPGKPHVTKKEIGADGLSVG